MLDEGRDGPREGELQISCGGQTKRVRLTADEQLDRQMLCSIFALPATSWLQLHTDGGNEVDLAAARPGMTLSLVVRRANRRQHGNDGYRRKTVQPLEGSISWADKTGAPAHRFSAMDKENSAAAACEEGNSVGEQRVVSGDYRKALNTVPRVLPSSSSSWLLTEAERRTSRRRISKSMVISKDLDHVLATAEQHSIELPALFRRRSSSDAPVSADRANPGVMPKMAPLNHGVCPAVHCDRVSLENLVADALMVETPPQSLASSPAVSTAMNTAGGVFADFLVSSMSLVL